MRWQEWEPFYREIIEEFGYSREKDELAAKILNALLANKSVCDDECISRRIHPEVTVCGGASSLPGQLDEFGLIGTIIAADNATSVLLMKGLLPDLIVTDLDGNVRDQIMANAEGSLAIVHAHGDNIPALQEHLPHFNGPISGTTQSIDVGVVRNYGGFTDGDRAVSIARHFGAKRIRLLGFDFEEPAPKAGIEVETKRRKLSWARRLIFDNNPEHVVLWSP